WALRSSQRDLLSLHHRFQFDPAHPTVIVPSTMAWLFASLTPAVSFSLIGVIVGEFIGAEHGIGRMIIEAEARGEAARMMVAVFVLMIVGVILASLVRRLQAYLLRWRPAQSMAT